MLHLHALFNGGVNTHAANQLVHRSAEQLHTEKENAITYNQMALFQGPACVPLNFWQSF